MNRIARAVKIVLVLALTITQINFMPIVVHGYNELEENPKVYVLNDYEDLYIPNDYEDLYVANDYEDYGELIEQSFGATAEYVPELLFADDMLLYVEEGDFFQVIEPRNVPAIGSGLVQFVLEPVNWNTSWGTLDQARAAAFNVSTVVHPLFANATTTNVATGVNGRFGRDAIYLGTSSNGNRFRIMIAGFEGYVNRTGTTHSVIANVNGTNRTFQVRADAVFVPFGNYPTGAAGNVRSVSHYVNRNGELFRYLTNNVTSEGGFVRFLTGPAPSWMATNTRLYSFDGIYFYNNPRNIRANGSGAVNGNNPHFNYFQYLSFRTRSLVTAAQLDNFLHNELATDANRNTSVMTGQGQHFVNAHLRYGVNTLLQYAKALHESGRGLSAIAINNNNLFGLNAVDAAPGENASVFPSVAASINDHANGWMSRGYLWPRDWRYEGPHVGHKGSGINVRYATDPYWGQKIAGWAFRIDRTLNNQDRNREQIAIRRNTSSVAVTNAGGTTLYTANPRGGRYFPFLVRGISGNRLRVLTDPAIVNGIANQTALFNRNNAVGYINNTNLWITGASTPNSQNDAVFTATATGVALSNTDIRPERCVNSNAIGSIRRGEAFAITGRSRDWIRVNMRGIVGWVRDIHVGETTRLGATTARTNLRSGPGTDRPFIRVIANGTNLRILGVSDTGNWTRVRVGNNTGWILSRNIRTRNLVGHTSGAANLRNAPTSEGVIRRVPRHTNLTILGHSGNFTHVRVEGQYGWITSSFVRNGRR